MQSREDFSVIDRGEVMNCYCEIVDYPLNLIGKLFSQRISISKGIYLISPWCEPWFAKYQWGTFTEPIIFGDKIFVNRGGGSAMVNLYKDKNLMGVQCGLEYSQKSIIKKCRKKKR